MLKNTFDQQKSDIADSLDDFSRRLRALDDGNVANFGPAFFQGLRDKIQDLSDEVDDLEKECAGDLEDDSDSEDIEGSGEEDNNPFA